MQALPDAGMNALFSAPLWAALQSQIEISERPFLSVAQQSGCSESAVLEELKRGMENGMIRRFGGVFNAVSLGYESTLAATELPLNQRVESAERLNPHPEITHSYERLGSPSLWFTLTAHHTRMETEKAKIELLLGVPVIWLPATRRFKVQVLFDFGTGIMAPAPHRAPLVINPDECEKRLIRRVQGTLPLVENPFAEVARETGMTVEACLRTLRHWKTIGALRRIGIILRHTASGIGGNGMGLWQVTPEDGEFFGRQLAAQPDVTHCYLRASHPQIPGNLYAMIHAADNAALWKRFHELEKNLLLPSGKLWLSVREFKKSSPRFFEET